MKEIVRCKDCPNWKHGVIRENYCQVFDWCSDADDGCTFESEDEEVKADENEKVCRALER